LHQSLGRKTIREYEMPEFRSDSSDLLWSYDAASVYLNQNTGAEVGTTDWRGVTHTAGHQQNITLRRTDEPRGRELETTAIAKYCKYVP